MKIVCPVCSSEIPLEDVNISTDIALCRNCKQDFRLSEIRKPLPDKIDLDNPPPGTWCIEDIDGVNLGATTRSCFAFFIVPFAIVWVGGSMAGIYGSQIFSGNFSLILSLFGIPFLIGSILITILASMCVAGKIVIRIFNDEMEIFTGVAGIGTRKRFDLNDITTIEEGNPNYTYSGQSSRGITIKGSTKYTFGTMLSDERRCFIMNVLQLILNKHRQRRL